MLVKRRELKYTHTPPAFSLMALMPHVRHQCDQYRCTVSFLRPALVALASAYLPLIHLRVDHHGSQTSAVKHDPTKEKKTVCRHYRPGGRRSVKLLLMLSPQAELSSTSKTSCALTLLFALLRAPAAPGSASRGLGGLPSALANCQSLLPSAGTMYGEVCGVVPLVGDWFGVI